MIPLSQGQSALVDDEDFEWLSKYKWGFYGPKNYAQNGARNRKPQTILMHRLILDAPKGLVVDHIDGNGLNNQRSNLRLATRRQNAHNRPKQANNQSGFKGISKHHRRWKATIRANGKCIYLGLFKTAELAGAVYDQAALKFHGEFARMNTEPWAGRPPPMQHVSEMRLWQDRDAKEFLMIILAQEYCDSVVFSNNHETI
jgi:HNH endonuclease